MLTINNSNHTDPLNQLLINTFAEYTVGESGTGSWQKIKQRVFKHNFLKFNPFRFNVYYSLVVTGVIISLGAQIFISDIKDKDSIPQQHTNDNIETIVLPQTKDNKKKPLDLEQPDRSSLVDQNQSKHNPKVVEEHQPTTIMNTSAHAKSNKTENESSTNEDNHMLDKKTISEKKIKPIDVITKPEVNNESIGNNELPSAQSQDQQVLYVEHDSLNFEEKKDTIKSPSILKQDPVIQIDTIVKVIKKRRKRKK